MNVRSLSVLVFPKSTRSNNGGLSVVTASIGFVDRAFVDRAHKNTRPNPSPLPFQKKKRKRKEILKQARARAQDSTRLPSIRRIQGVDTFTWKYIARVETLSVEIKSLRDAKFSCKLFCFDPCKLIVLRIYILISNRYRSKLNRNSAMRNFPNFRNF